MPRAPFQILVIPYRRTPEGLRYAVLRRRDIGIRQFIAGGGEDQESPEEAARREAFEEAGIPPDAPLLRLDSVASIPVMHFRERHLWGPDRYVIPEYAFGIECSDENLSISDEHTEYQWLDYRGADERLRFDSNRTALWELDRRLLNNREEPHHAGILEQHHDQRPG